MMKVNLILTSKSFFLVMPWMIWEKGEKRALRMSEGRWRFKICLVTELKMKLNPTGRGLRRTQKIKRCIRCFRTLKMKILSLKVRAMKKWIQNLSFCTKSKAEKIVQRSASCVLLKYTFQTILKDASR